MYVCTRLDINSIQMLFLVHAYFILNNIYLHVYTMYVCIMCKCVQIFAGRSLPGGISEKNSHKRYPEKEFLL